VHSQLNPTRVDSIVEVANVAGVQAAVSLAAKRGKAVSIFGGRHAMGAQQFASGAIALDMCPLRAIGDLDVETGRIVVGAGVQWPELVSRLVETQAGRRRQWGIVQKQTGADRLSIG
jgi:FAD/FMN-containing dehydrogenase